MMNLEMQKEKKGQFITFHIGAIAIPGLVRLLNKIKDCNSIATSGA